jgi:hypothetical protein
MPSNSAPTALRAADFTPRSGSLSVRNRTQIVKNSQLFLVLKGGAVKNRRSKKAGAPHLAESIVNGKKDSDIHRHQPIAGPMWGTA